METNGRGAFNVSTISAKTKLLLCLAALVVLFVLPQGAFASKTQLSVMEDNGLVQSSNIATRDAALDEMQLLGADVVKVFIHWRSVAPSNDSKSVPSGFDPTDITQYDGGAIAMYRSIEDGIRSRGMEPWFLLGGPSPDWALGSGAPSGNQVFKPSAVLYGQFAQAMGAGFPRVNMWSAWNEPNHAGFLAPTFGKLPKSKKKGSLSAIHYRSMYQEAYEGLVAAGAGADQIFFGELLPISSPAKKSTGNIPPVTWLLDFFCLDKKLKKLKGSAAKLRGCSKFKRINAAGFAYHPYTRPVRPFVSDSRYDNAPIVNMKRIYKVLDAAAKAKRIRKGMKVYNSEFGFQSDPPDPIWASIQRIPEYLNLSEFLSYKDGRLMTYSQYQLRDDPLRREFGIADTRRYAGFQMGLYFEDGRRKSNVYEAYQLPIVVSKTRRSSAVKIWGAGRALPTGTSFEVQVKVGSSFKTVKTISSTNAAGYFTTTVKRSRANKSTWRLLASGITSRSAKAATEIKASSSVRR